MSRTLCLMLLVASPVRAWAETPAREDTVQAAQQARRAAVDKAQQDHLLRLETASRVAALFRARGLNLLKKPTPNLEAERTPVLDLHAFSMPMARFACTCHCGTPFDTPLGG